MTDRKESGGGGAAVGSRANKFKKSKNDDIRSALGVYLKHKHYTQTEKFRKSDLILTQTKGQFVFNKMIESDVSKSNSFLYSNVLCLTSSLSIMDQQFSLFVKYVQCEEKHIKSQLTNLFGPMISHLYIELLKGQEHKPAIEFLKKYAHLVGNVENYDAPLPNKVNGCSVIEHLQDDKNCSITTQIQFFTNISLTNIESQDSNYFKSIIQSLSTCTTIEHIELSEPLMLFRAAKFEINLTITAVNSLRKYLANQGHVLILNILHTWIKINVVDIDCTADGFVDSLLQNDEELHMLHAQFKNVRSAHIQEESLDNSKNNLVEKEKPENTYLKKLKHSNVKVQKVDIPTRCIKFNDPEKIITTCTMDVRECHIAMGLNDSVVKLYPLNNRLLRGRNSYIPISYRSCPWNGDCIDDEFTDDEEIVLSPNSKNKFQIGECNFQNLPSDNGSIVLRGHSRGVTDVLFSSYYPLILSVSRDSSMRIWKSTPYYNCAAIYKGHNYPIWCLAESPINMFVSTGSKDLTARLWSLERSSPLITYVGHTQDVDCLAFHPNGSYIATGSSDLSVRLWSVTDGKLFRVFADCKFPITSVAFSPNGKFLAAAGEKQKIRIFDLAAGSQFAELKDHSASVTSITWSPSGNKFASSCSDGTIRIWDVSKMSINDGSGQSATSSYTKILCNSSSCSNVIKIHFNSNETITCIGRT